MAGDGERHSQPKRSMDAGLLMMCTRKQSEERSREAGGVSDRLQSRCTRHFFLNPFRSLDAGAAGAGDCDAGAETAGAPLTDLSSTPDQHRGSALGLRSSTFDDTRERVRSLGE